MTVIAIIVGALAPDLSQIPSGCWAQRNASHEAWVVLSTKGAITPVEVVSGSVMHWYDGDWHPYPKGDRITVSA